MLHRRRLLAQLGAVGAGLGAAPATDDTPAPRRVVVAGGHLGDPEHGCGGTFARLADLGHQVVLRYLNDGVPAGKPRDGVRIALRR